MPQYELMYILAATVSEEQMPEVADQINKMIEQFGGQDVQETRLGKKKLAYPIKKTRNGFYHVVSFTMDPKHVNELDAKIRTQDSTIIRYLLINTNEHHIRLEKDRVNQAQLQSNRPSEEVPESEKNQETATPETETTATEVPKPESSLEDKIDAALTEDISKN